MFMCHFLGIVYVYFIFRKIFHSIFLLIVISITIYYFASWF